MDDISAQESSNSVIAYVVFADFTQFKGFYCSYGYNKRINKCNIPINYR